jgi:hypothetical protein
VMAVAGGTGDSVAAWRMVLCAAIGATRRGLPYCGIQLQSILQVDPKPVTEAVGCCLLCCCLLTHRLADEAGKPRQHSCLPRTQRQEMILPR